jgi:hypothetical protein
MDNRRTPTELKLDSSWTLAARTLVCGMQASSGNSSEDVPPLADPWVHLSLRVNLEWYGMTTPSVAPSSSREDFADELRGFASLGIVFVNAPFLGISAEGFTAASVATWFDRDAGGC